MNGVGVLDLINEYTMLEPKICDLLGITLIVGEQFGFLIKEKEIDLDALLEEGKYEMDDALSDAYDILLDIAIEIANKQFPFMDDGMGFTYEDIKEDAKRLIRKHFIQSLN